MYQQAVDQFATKALVRERYDDFVGGEGVASAEGRDFATPAR